MNRAFYFNEQVTHVLDVLNYEFGSDTALETTDRHDECPSVIVSLLLDPPFVQNYKLYLPSDHRGDYAEFIVIRLHNIKQDPADGDFIDGLKCLGDVVAFFNNVI